MVDVSTEDLISLHLEAFADVRDQPSAPTEITATGIGDALEVDDTAASRVQLLNVLSELEEEGLVTAEERPVDGRAAPRTVYFLTDHGRTHASSLRERVRSASVVLTNGTEREVELGEIDQYLDDETPLLTALARLTDDGEVPLAGQAGASFINRETALETLVDAIETSIDMECQTVTIAGPSGMGKTALVREAIDQAAADDEELVTAHGTCPTGTSNPYDPFRQAFESVPDEGALLERLMEAKLSFTPDDPEELEAQRNAFFNDIADGLRDAAADRPIVLFLDNLQWADEATLDLFEHLTTSISDWLSQIAFVGTYRPDALAGGDNPLAETLVRVEGETAYLDISLDPLAHEHTEALLGGIIGGHELPDDFVDLVQEQTGGNPLFVRETATHLLESGLVDAARDVFPTSADEVSLPQGVTEQIDQRIMALDDNSRELLRLGAVAGERVPARVLAEASDIPSAKRREYEDVLIASQIWEQMDPAPDTAPGAEADLEVIADGGRDFRFISGGLREAVVDRLPDTLAPRYHMQIAEAFERVFEGSLDDYAGQIAYHYEQAGKSGDAIEYYRRAGERAWSAYAHDEAAASYERALELGRESDTVEDELLAELAIELARIHTTTGDYEGALAVIEDGREYAPRESRERGQLLSIKAQTETKSGRYDRARETAERQRELAADIGDRELEADALYQLGTAAWRQADHERAAELLEEALAGFETVDQSEGIAKTRKNLGNVAAMQRDEEAAREHYDLAREHYESSDDRHGLATIHNNLSILEFRDRNRAAAMQHLEDALAAYEAVGDRHGSATVNLNLATRFSEVGEVERAEAHFEAAIDGFRTVDARHGLAKAQYQLGRFKEQLGEFTAARDRLQQALEGFETVDNQSDIASVHFAFGNLARKQGQYPRARDSYEEAKERYVTVGDHREVSRCDLQLGWVSKLQGDPDEARQRFDAALERFEELDSDLGIAWAHFYLGELTRDIGEYEAAVEHFETASTGGAFEEDHAQGRLLQARGELALARGHPDEARELGERALEKFQAVEDAFLTGRSRLLLGRVAAETEALDAAREHYESALETFESVGAVPDVLEALKELVETSLEAVDVERADDWRTRAESVLDGASAAVAERHRDWVETHRRESG